MLTQEQIWKSRVSRLFRTLPFDGWECKKVKAHSETVITESVTSCPPDPQALESIPQEMNSVSHKYFYLIEADAKYAPATNPNAALLNIIFHCVSLMYSVWAKE